ncbi:MAG TPA: endonuclease domain-containing protein [Thermoanaerobaculia bacterium]|nr:endonuclease domain-containing protein [Thermoanaerobaculia bacterium]
MVRAKNLRKITTPSEEALWERLRGRQLLGLKFRRQMPIGPYVADFFCHELRLVLELDGAVHEEPTQMTHDLNRDDNLKALGYRVLRVTNQQVHHDLDAILTTIARLHRHRSVSPLSRPAGWEDGREGPGE